MSGNDAIERPTSSDPCPVCGHPMFEHAIDRSSHDFVLICPTDERLPLPADDGPLGELGMPASEERVEKLGRHRH